jgi:hypothetical protein
MTNAHKSQFERALEIADAKQPLGTLDNDAHKLGRWLSVGERTRVALANVLLRLAYLDEQAARPAKPSDSLRVGPMLWPMVFGPGTVFPKKWTREELAKLELCPHDILRSDCLPCSAPTSPPGEDKPEPDDEEDDFAIVRAALLYNMRELDKDSLIASKEWKALNRIQARATKSCEAQAELTRLREENGRLGAELEKLKAHHDEWFDRIINGKGDPEKEAALETIRLCMEELASRNTEAARTIAGLREEKSMLQAGSLRDHQRLAKQSAVVEAARDVVECMRHGGLSDLAALVSLKLSPALSALDTPPQPEPTSEREIVVGSNWLSRDGIYSVHALTSDNHEFPIELHRISGVYGPAIWHLNALTLHKSLTWVSDPKPTPESETPAEWGARLTVACCDCGAAYRNTHRRSCPIGRDPARSVTERGDDCMPDADPTPTAESEAP